MNSHPFITKALEERNHTNQFRNIVESSIDGVYIQRNGNRLINFSSNDYLGLASNPDVALASKKFIDRFGNGSAASRLITGTGEYHIELEKKLASALGTEASLIFNSGYQANTTVIPALAGRNSLVLSDKLNHNSLLQGANLSLGKLQRYRHNDPGHLKTLLKRAEGHYERILIVTESVFSMDGDVADLAVISSLAKSYGAMLMVDEAHAIGVLGENGMGLCVRKYNADIILGTFGKAFGSFGAFVACSQAMRDYLINFCGGFIYTTALPPSIIGAATKSLELVAGMDGERLTLAQNADYLRKRLRDSGYDTLKSGTQIIPVIIGDEEKTVSLSKYLADQGIFAVAIRPPTVKQNSSRIRITLSSMHTKEHIDQLMTALIAWNDRS
ncbi:MAG: 8-amino-7-oxononanoate synthase [Balneolales bacterium]